MMINELISRYPKLENIKPDIISALELMLKTVKSGGKILLCGNGGSSADCDHIVGELMKGFLSKRPVKNEFSKVLSELYPDESEYFSDNLQGHIRFRPALTYDNGRTLLEYLNQRTSITLPWTI